MEVDEYHGISDSLSFRRLGEFPSSSSDSDSDASEALEMCSRKSSVSFWRARLFPPTPIGPGRLLELTGAGREWGPLIPLLIELISERRRSSVFSFSDCEEVEVSRMAMMSVIVRDLDVCPLRHSSMR